MSLQIAAQHLASKGRNGDSMLVHMTPNEVKGLQSLAMAHGGSLSVNPETGLVEANFLESLLPTLIGAGLTFFSGGVINPLTAGMIVGGIQTARTGDLGKGIMAGLGAYGGGGLGSSLGAAGSQAAGFAEGAKALGTDVASLSTPESMAQALGADATGALDPSKLSAFTGAYETGASQALANPSLATLGQGVQSAASQPSAFVNTLGSQFPTMTEKAAAAYPTVAALSAPKPITPVEPEESNYAGPYLPQQRTVQYPTNRDPNDSSEFTYFSPMNPYPGFIEPAQPVATNYADTGPLGMMQRMVRDNQLEDDLLAANQQNRFGAAEGGLMGLARGQYFDDQPGSDDGGMKTGGFDMRDGSFVMSAREVAEMGNGSSNAGLERLSKMGAKPIRGKGDGVSDSIKANIGGQQEARVARDEAYFPPEAVKRIGGGNSKKGAKKLYALMSAAEKARKKAPRGEDSGLHRLMSA